MIEICKSNTYVYRKKGQQIKKNSMKLYKFITKHIGEMVGISLSLTRGLEFEPWECSYIMW